MIYFLIKLNTKFNCNVSHPKFLYGNIPVTVITTGLKNECYNKHPVEIISYDTNSDRYLVEFQNKNKVKIKFKNMFILNYDYQTPPINLSTNYRGLEYNFNTGQVKIPDGFQLFTLITFGENKNRRLNVNNVKKDNTIKNVCININNNWPRKIRTVYKPPGSDNIELFYVKDDKKIKLPLDENAENLGLYFMNPPPGNPNPLIHIFLKE